MATIHMEEVRRVHVLFVYICDYFSTLLSIWLCCLSLINLLFVGVFM